jgi:hypothetical protein
MWNAFLFVGLMVIAHPPQPVKAPPTALPPVSATADAASDASKDAAPAPVPTRETVAPTPAEIDAP